MSEAKSRIDRLVRWLNELASELCLDMYVSTDYPEQCPEHKMAKWHDLLWLMIPIVGIIIFSESIRERYKAT